MRWHRTRPFRQGRYAPDLWRVWVAVPIWAVAAGALAAGIYLGLRAVAVPHPGPNGGPAVIDPLDVIKTTITVAGFFGAVLLGVYGYRKQRLIEGDARRADAEQLAQRYTTAADQLGHDKAAVRLAGVYAMARLADDWWEQRKECIDVLCAYLRMPYETDPASDKHREGEQEVRLAIIDIIRDHLQDPGAPTTWCGYYLKFTGATFDGGDFGGAKFTSNVSFHGAKFTGEWVSFDGAEFISGQVSFHEAELGGGSTRFRNAKFSGGEVLFEDAKFSGGMALFEGAEFSGGEVFFSRAELAGGLVSFESAKFTGSRISFYRAKLTSGAVLFYGAEFTDGKLFFVRADFAGSKVSFYCAKFVGGEISFDDVKSSDGDVSFEDTEFTGSRIIWGPFEPPAAWIALQEQKR